MLPRLPLPGAASARQAKCGEEALLGVGNPLLEGRPDDPQDGAYFKKRAIDALDKQTCSQRSGAPITSAMPRALGSFSTLFRGTQADIEQVRELTPLPETADELCEVGRRLGVP